MAKTTAKQMLNRVKAWFVHTFFYRGYNCKHIDNLCPYCSKQFKKWCDKKDTI